MLLHTRKVEKGTHHMAKKINPVAGVSLMAYIDKNSILAEQCRIIRSNIQFSSIDQPIQSVVITSAAAGEGKSTVAANLAVVFADSGKKTLLVDCDLRRPTVALTFKQWNHDGLTNLIGKGTEKIEDFVHESGIDNLSILTSGPKPPNPSEMLGSQRMTDLMNEFKKEFDFIIYDLPPVSIITDAQIIAAKADATVLVARQNQTQKQDFLQSVKLLKMAKANVIGVVYNNVKKNTDNYYYYG